MTDNKVLTKKSFTDRIVSEFKNLDQESFTTDEIETIIKDFSRMNYEAKKNNTEFLPFGKYKYKPIKEVFNFDKKYMVWLSKQSYIAESYPELLKKIKELL